MVDDEFRDRWKDAEGGHGRLRWARIYWQKRAGAIAATGTDAARSLGWKPNTYLAYERDPSSSKHTPLDHQAAIEFGRRFQVSWRWLLLGVGSPFDEELPEVQARVIRAMETASEHDQKAFAAMADAFFRSRLAG